MTGIVAKAQETINWMSIEEAEARCAEEPRMVFIDVLPIGAAGASAWTRTPSPTP